MSLTVQAFVNRNYCILVRVIVITELLLYSSYATLGSSLRASVNE